MCSIKILILFINTLFSQSYQYPFPENPPKEIYQNRVELVSQKLEENQLYLCLSAEFYLVNKHQTFRQNSDFLYLTGIPKGQSVIFISKNGFDIDKKNYKSLIFLDIKTKNEELWEGRTIKTEFISQRLGFDKIIEIDSLDYYLDILLENKQELIVSPFTKGVNFSPFKNSKKNDDELEIKIIKKIRNKNPYLLTILDNQILKSMRQVKDRYELKLIQKSIDITMAAFVETIIGIEPEKSEYQIESIMEANFLKLGAENNAYNSIIGSGENSCFLHYVDNRKKLKLGDLILMDCGAEYHGYASDITRTVPLNGKFTEEQKIIYNIVLNAQKKAIKFCKVGKDFGITDSIAKDFVAEELVKLKILEKKEDVKIYFPHGTSHYLGLDVHDLGDYEKFVSGNVITVEPGIYIPIDSNCDPKWWNIGVRIEDDILITDNEPTILSRRLPKEIDDLEKLME